MATLNVSKWGQIARTAQTSHANARDGTTATATIVNPSYASAAAIQYKRQSGRGSTVYSIYRSFYYFDTSGISGDVTDSSLNLMGSAAETAQVIIVPCTAFGGDGTADIVAADYNNISFNSTYGAAYTGWDDGANNEIEFRSNNDAEGTVNAAIRDQNYFICAVIEFARDYSDSDPGSNVQLEAGINYATAAYLDYTEASSGYANDVIGVATGNIGKVLGVATANIGKVIGV